MIKRLGHHLRNAGTTLTAIHDTELKSVEPSLQIRGYRRSVKEVEEIKTLP